MKTKLPRLNRLIILFTLIFYFISTNSTKAIVGDVTVSASSTPNVACAGCIPGGTGTQLCYEVSLDPNSANENAIDFHIRVNDNVEANFKCATIEKYDPSDGSYDDITNGNNGGHWQMSYESQCENDTNRHYVSFYDNSLTPLKMKKGDKFKFCFVYCGQTSNLDNTVEFILTNDGSKVPDYSSVTPERNDVPDGAGQTDDPGWKGTKSTGGTNAGFSTISVSPSDLCTQSIPTIPEWGLIIFGILLVLISIVFIRRS